MEKNGNLFQRLDRKVQKLWTWVMIDSCIGEDVINVIISYVLGTVGFVIFLWGCASASFWQTLLGIVLVGGSLMHMSMSVIEATVHTKSRKAWWPLVFAAFPLVGFIWSPIPAISLANFLGTAFAAFIIYFYARGIIAYRAYLQKQS